MLFNTIFYFLAKFIPYSSDAGKMFSNRYYSETNYPKLISRKRLIDHQNSVVRTEEDVKKYATQRLKQLKAHNKKLKECGINYEYPIEAFKNRTSAEEKLNATETEKSTPIKKQKRASIDASIIEIPLKKKSMSCDVSGTGKKKKSLSPQTNETMTPKKKSMTPQKNDTMTPKKKSLSPKKTITSAGKKSLTPQNVTVKKKSTTPSKKSSLSAKEPEVSQERKSVTPKSKKSVGAEKGKKTPKKGLSPVSPVARRTRLSMMKKQNV